MIWRRRRPRRHLDAFIDAEWRGAASPKTAGARRLLPGTMMALHVAPPRGEAVPLRRGRLFRQAHRPQLLAAEVKSKPAMLLVHGSADRRPYAALAGCGRRLEAAASP